MRAYSYSAWDGRQDFLDLDKDTLLAELENNLTSAGDLASALWKMQREGVSDGEGGHIPGNRELYQQLEEKRRQLLDAYDFAPLAQALRRQLEKINAAEPVPDLPEDVKQQLDALKQHHFTSAEAQRELQRLLDSLQANSLEVLCEAGHKPTATGSGSNLERRTPSLSETLDILSTLQKMDRLESQLRASQRRRGMAAVDPALVAEVLGGEFAASVERLRRIDRMLEDAGYLRDSSSGFELTPRAVRKIGQRALEEIYSALRRDGAGAHTRQGAGAGGLSTGEPRKYEFGDDFNLHLMNTVMNSLRRAPRKPPLSLTPDDFETLRTEPVTRAATVLLLDLSRSMPRHGNFQPAKRVALALTELIQSRFPTDTLHVAGFSTYARLIEHGDLPQMGWDDRDRHTNIQDGLRLARRLLARDANANKQIIIITDGEPTAHFEGDQVLCKYPPTARTRQATLNEVRACTEEGISISAFIFEGAEFTRDFINGLARINRGRIFFTSAATLGKYVLADYTQRRTKMVA